MDDREQAVRARRLRARLERCDVCPRRCGADRSREEKGVCGTGKEARVASFGPHFGEEAPLTGVHGSGTVFFSQCNLHCAFCQNFDISHFEEGEAVTAEALSLIFLSLQRLGCHNINLVTPTHVTPQVLEALERSRKSGLSLPVVYNCGGYESLDTLRELDGVVDIYMPDVKFLKASPSARYCDAPDYPEAVRNAVKEMARQVGSLVLDGSGIAIRGLLVRHLVMPGDASTTREVIDFLAGEIGTDTYVNLMDQYRPCGRAGEFSEIARRTSRREWEDARDYALSRGMTRLDRP